MYKMHYFSN